MSSSAPHLIQKSNVQGSSETGPPCWTLNPAWKWGLRLVAVLLALVITFVQRFAMNVDGISYLDMAYAYMRGDWKIAVNSYWGAGYAWLLGIFLTGFHVPMRWESTAVHVVNFLIFLAALAAFEYFLLGVIQLARNTPVLLPGTARFDDWMWWVVGYSLFLVVNVFITPLTIVTPDLCVEAVVLLASAIIVRIAAGTASKLAYPALGVTLGAGYLIKSPMFPLGLVYLALAWLAAPRGRRTNSQVAMATILFLAISTPYIAAISRSVGKPTIGENGTVTYGHYVLGVADFSYWTGEVPGLGTPRHSAATRKLLSHPDVYVFSTATGGTLPPYYNPPYWADGLKLHLSATGEIRVLKQSAAELLNLFYYLREYVLIFLVFLFLQQGARNFLRRLFAGWTIWLPGLAALAMYLPLHLELRFLGGFILFFWAAVSLALEFPRGELTARLFRACALAVVLLITYRLVHDPAGPLRERVPPMQWQVARWLQTQGLRPGDNVAEMLRHGNDFHYWAHLAEARIVADIPFQEKEEFWASPPDVQRRAEQVMSNSGARFLLTQNPPTPLTAGWQCIPGTNYAALPLPPR